MKQYTLSRQGLLNSLDKLKADPPLLSIYMKSGTAKEEVEKTLLSVLDRGSLVDGLVEKAIGSSTGAVIFYHIRQAQLIRPPFPLEVSECEKGYFPEPLTAMLKKDWRVGLALVRLGQFAIGVFEGDRLLAYKAGTGLVHARHHKGGSSANRFARHREKQMEYFFTRVEAHAREVLEPHLRELDYIIYGGTQETLQALRKQCGFFSKLEKVVPRLLNVREPKYSTLAGAIEQVYASVVYEYRDDQSVSLRGTQ